MPARRSVGRRDMTIPNGTATSAASAVDTALIFTCSHARSRRLAVLEHRALARLELARGSPTTRSPRSARDEQTGVTASLPGLMPPHAPSPPSPIERRIAVCSESGVSTPEEAAVVEHRHPSGIVQQHHRQRVLQRRVGAHPCLHALRPIRDPAVAIGAGRGSGSRAGRPAASRTMAHGASSASIARRASSSDASSATTGGFSSSATSMPVTLSRLSPRSAPDEVGDEVRRRVAEHLGRRVVLLEHTALAQDGDPVAELHGLVDVVRDEDDRLAHLALEPEELALQPLAGDGVDGAERLVHQQHRGVGAQRARHADALALAAGELFGIAVAELRGLEPDEREQLVDPSANARPVPAQADGAPFPRCRRSSCGGTARSAGSRSRSGVAASPGRRRVTSSPSRKMRPAVGSISRLTIFIVVVLPHPDGPTSTQISPSGTSSERSSTATWPFGIALRDVLEADHAGAGLGGGR